LAFLAQKVQKIELFPLCQFLLRCTAGEQKTGCFVFQLSQLAAMQTQQKRVDAVLARQLRIAIRV
jgi:hypothetical protein